MEKKIEFKSGKNTLRGSLFMPRGKGPFPGVIFFHGNGGRGEKYFEAGKKFSERGIIAFAFNFTGCGESTGNYLTQTHKDAFRDAKYALKYLTGQKKVNKNRIGIVGGSFGGFVASMILPEVKIKSLILISPSAHDDPTSEKLDIGPIEKEVEYFSNKNNWINAKSYKNISEFKGSLLVIKSENDENIPADVVDRYYERAFNTGVKKLKEIKGSDHRLSEQWMRDEVFELMNDWFFETL